MKATYLYLAALGLASASLSSCSRASYSFNPATPAYLNSVPAATTPPAPKLQPLAAVPAGLPAVAQTTLPAPAATRTPVKLAPSTARYTIAAPAAIATQAPKPSLAQRLVLKKLTRQLTKAQSHSQNTAGIAETAGRKGGFTVAIIGLVALIIGIIASSGFLVTIGIILLVVGVVLALLSIF